MGVYFVMSVTEQEVKEQEKHLWNEGDEHIALPADADEDGDEPRGVVFVGRIPFGFFEEQLLEYFSQFGDITRLRLSRNKKTGKSKHYAFIEFKEEEVADIVVDAMDGYLLFGHILQVKRIEPDKVHPKIWKGRYSNPSRGLHIKPKLRKTIEKQKIEKTNRVKSEEEVKNLGMMLIAREMEKRKKLEKLGIKYDFPGYTALATKQEKKEAASKVDDDSE